ncbi:MAG: dephospho-CoA kinase [Gammaproteobacteria bacterium]|nr:MAG: dephospho-CoA kinase [Gammaproteobacteria bacterium]
MHYVPTIIIGLTGGIACGKTTASDFFADKGIEIVDADLVAREVVEPGQPALEKIIEVFGISLIQADGTLDRQKMRDLVFADADKRTKLESILHPLIRKRMAEQLALCRGHYVIYSVPLLLESGLDKQADRVLVIDVAPDVQMRRLLSRDQTTLDQAQAIIDAQLPREKRNLAADDIIENSGTLEQFIDQLEAIHGYYLTLPPK